MTDSKKPTHRAFIVKKFNDKEGTEKSRWLDIGAFGRTATARAST